MLSFLEHLGDYVHFAGRALLAGLLALRRPRLLWPQLYSILLGALPLALVPGLALGVVVWIHLRGVIRPEYARRVPEYLALAVVLEFAPLGAGLIVAGRSGASLGADPQVLLEMIGPSYGGSTIFTRHLPRIIARDFRPDGPLRILNKDMGVVRAVADATGVALPLASQVEPMIAEAIARGMGDEDMSALVKLYEERAGTQVGRAETG